MKLGFFGGSFNPPTNAHIDLAKEILKKCELDKLIFVPIGDFYKKAELVNFKDRYEMLKIICKNNQKLQVSNIEDNQKKVLYAIDVFEFIKKLYKNDEIYYIMGTDNLQKIKEWKEYDKLISNYKYIILERESNAFNNIICVDERMNKYKDNFIIISNKNYMDISSTNVRNKIKNNEDISNLVPKEINDYIKQNNLYIQ